MELALAVMLFLAAALTLRPPNGARARLRRVRQTGPRVAAYPPGPVVRVGSGLRWPPGRSQSMQSPSMTLLVQQLAALLKGGRAPARIWDELSKVQDSSGGRGRGNLSVGSTAMVAAARAAALGGMPVSAALRRALPKVFPRQGSEARIWWNLAACLDIAEASGCPLADVLTRFAAQLEAEDDAEAARHTALAGPKATVSLLTWLPVLGLGLGSALGVDPLSVLLQTPLGLGALAAGLGLTVAGRLWSARLVAAAAGAGQP